MLTFSVVEYYSEVISFFDDTTKRKLKVMVDEVFCEGESFNAGSLGQF